MVKARGHKRSNSFAKSKDGLEIAYLDVMGYKLAPTQGELTPLQRDFLLEALPEINRLMMGDSDSSQGLIGAKKSLDKSKKATKNMNDLKSMKQMFNARKKRR